MAEAFEPGNTEQGLEAGTVLEEYPGNGYPEGAAIEKRIGLLPASMPTSVQGENVNMGGNQTVVGGDYVINVGYDGSEKGDTEFNLESVRQQLMQEYKETRGTLPLLPGMPEEFATMEDIFVNLEIVEEDKKPSGILTTKLRSCGELVCIKRQKGDIIEAQKVKRLLVRGNPGTGKSSTVSKLAYDWACNKQDSPISEYQLLFAITINEIDTNTDLIGIIQDQLLPGVSGEALRAYIQSHASSICLLLDGYDEATKCFDKCRDIRNLLSSKWLADACVITTSRTNEIGRFLQNYGPCTQVEVMGLSRLGRQEYVDKFFQISGSDKKDMATGKKVNTEAFLTHIRGSQRLKQLSFIPIILSMLCVLWVEDATLPLSITALYNEVVLHLAKHRFSKNTTDDLDIESIQTWVQNVLSHVGKIALEGLLADSLVFKASSFDKKQLEEACSLGILVKERKRSRLSVSHHVTFLHKTFQEFCAAVYWGHLVDTDRKKFDQHLQQIREDNVFEMDYLLRFSCGFSVNAAKIIIPRVVQIMCQHKELKDDDGDVRRIDDNICQQIPLFLLHEAESNDLNVRESYKLHSLLKPVFSTVVYHAERCVEFHYLLLSYLALLNPNMGTVTKFHRPWLADVERVNFYTAPEAGHAILSGFEQIAHVMKSIMNELQVGLIIEHLCLHHMNIGVSVEKLVKAYKYMPRLKRLDLYHTNLKPSHCAALFDGFIAAGKMLSQQDEISSDAQCKGSGALQGGLSIERLNLSHNEICGSVEKLAQAYKYMPRLRRLILWHTSMNPSHCAALFDGFISAGKMLSQHEEMSSDAQGNWLGASQGGLSIENLDLSRNDIGESVENLARAYKYMSRLRFLELRRTKLKPSQCATLFDGFIAAGELQSHGNEMTTDVQGIEPSASQTGLIIEYLDLTLNDIGESVERLARAYRYMPRLRHLNVSRTSMKPFHCAALFDGFIAAGKMQSRQDEMSSDAQSIEASASQTGLSIEHLDLYKNTIGESYDKLVQALQYMPRLTYIDVRRCGLDEKSLQCLYEVLIMINGKFKQRAYLGRWEV